MCISDILEKFSNEYYHTKLEFTHNVGNRDVHYYVYIKRGDRNFVKEEEMKKFKELLNKFDLASEEWEDFKFELEESSFGLSMTLILLFILKKIIIFNFFYRVKCQLFSQSH